MNSINNNPISIISFLFCSSAILAIISLCINQHVRKLLKQHWKLIIFLLLINFIFKCPINFEFFDGIEYEDSYIFKASARALFENKYYIDHNNPFLPTACIFGSIRNCKISATYNGFYLGYPYIINLGYNFFGYNPNIANVISLVFSSFSIVLIFLISLIIINNVFYAISCSFIYITIPIFNVYSSTSLSEPLTNAYILLVLLIYIIFIYYPKNLGKTFFYCDILTILALISTMVFSILIKRVNLSLLFFLPLISLIHLYLNRQNVEAKKTLWRIIFILPLIIIVMLFCFTSLNIMGTLHPEKNDIGKEPFSLSYFSNLAPIFMKSFLNIKWYLFYSIFLLLGLFTFMRTRLGIFPAIIFLFYFVLYTTHYRSYYFIKGAPVSEGDSIRYMMSIIGMYSLIAGIGIYYSIKYFEKAANKVRDKNISKIFFAGIILIVLIISFIFTIKNRFDSTEDEYFVRIQPVIKTLDYVNNKETIIVTSEPLIFQIIGDSNMEIIDFCSISILIPIKMIDEIFKTHKVIYLQTIEQDSINIERYALQFKYIDSKKKRILYDGKNFKIYELL